MNKNNYVAIMAGGIGSRFWPMSRTTYPKQFLDILNTGKSLIQWTYERFKTFIPEENIFIITSEEYVELVKQQIPTIQSDNILAEPSKKNTAPCVAYMAFKLANINPDANFIVAPADHMILDIPEFTNSCNDALNFCDSHNAFVTLGIKPTYPNTGYGYIQYEQTYAAAENIFKVKTFTEKPTLEIAQSFIESGDFLWNAGIFIWKVSGVIKAFEHHQPEMFEVFNAEKENFNTEKEIEAISKIYPLCTNISIDFAIMEKAENVFVIPSSFGWSDLGTWTSAYDNLEKDYLGNAVACKNVIVIDATKCMVSAPNDKLVVLQGLDDFIVVDTKDVLMICKKENEQEIKNYVAEVKRNKGDKFL